MQIANIHDAKTHLSHLVECALAGEEVIIARAGMPLVRLTPMEHDTRPREGGQLHGTLWIAENFDAPDPEIEKLFYGDGK
jgi:prevent-host-death family protein